MKTYKQFIFEGYELNKKSRSLHLNYSYDGELKFTETLQFVFELKPSVNQQLLDNACFGLLLAGGVSYYKAYLAPQMVVRGRTLTPDQAAFFNKLYRNGLGEFLVRNQLDADRLALFPSDDSAEARPVAHDGIGALVPLGGGKDSLTTVGILKDAEKEFTTWTVNHENVILAQVQQIGVSHFQVERVLAPEIIEANRQDAYNGHIPISAYLAFAALVTAVLTGKRDIVLSNEASAGEGNLDYQGIAVNHQYSKTLEFEKDFQNYVKTNISPDIRYFSFLRSFSELYIAELFTGRWLGQFAGKFSSCNRNFTQGNHASLRWCGECPKCAFVYLIFAPFVPKQRLVELFSGRNLFDQPTLEKTYRELLGIEGHKPFDCIGEIRECRQAAKMALATGEYPELSRFKFSEFEYDYRTPQEHNMSDEYYELIESLSQILVD